LDDLVNQMVAGKIKLNPPLGPAGLKKNDKDMPKDKMTRIADKLSHIESRTNNLILASIAGIVADSVHNRDSKGRVKITKGEADFANAILKLVPDSELKMAAEEIKLYEHVREIQELNEWFGGFDPFTILSEKTVTVKKKNQALKK
jgi:hypothetical protein